MSSSAALMAGMAGTPGNGTRSGHPDKKVPVFLGDGSCLLLFRGNGSCFLNRDVV